jgi:hypothetical protein
LHRLCQDMRGVVAQQLQRVGMGAGDDLDLGVVVDDVGEILDLTVDLDGERGLGEPRADGGGDLRARNRAVEAAHIPIRQRDRDHERSENPRKIGGMARSGAKPPQSRGIQDAVKAGSPMRKSARQPSSAAALRLETAPSSSAML